MSRISTSVSGTIWRSVFPASIEIKEYPLLNNYQPNLFTRFLRGCVKLIALPFAKLLDLSSPIILGLIINVFDNVSEGKEDGVKILGITLTSRNLFYVYTFTWLANQWLTQSLNYLIESDGILASRMRLTEYIIKHDSLSLEQKNRPTGLYLDEIKGIDKAAREGSKLIFEIYASIMEFIIIVTILSKLYPGEFGLSFGVAPAIYAATSLIDIFLFAGFSMPIKHASLIMSEFFSQRREGGEVAHDENKGSLSRLPIFNELSKDQRQSVSGGQAQQINFTRTMLKNSAKIFIFDEPTASLDPKSRQLVLAEIQSLKSPDRIVIIVSHHESELKIADRRIRIHKGEIIPESNKKSSPLPMIAPVNDSDQSEESTQSPSAHPTSISSSRSVAFSFQPPESPRMPLLNETLLSENKLVIGR